MDKLRALTFFCRTVETGSIAGASRMLGVVPSALSKTISALEDELGFRLLHRSTRNLSLTDEGSAYYDRCRCILADLEAAEEFARGGRGEARGTLRLGFHPGLRAAMLNALGPFLEAHPDVRVETMITNTASAVIDDGLDVVIRVGPLADSSLTARQIGWTHTVACAAPSYLAAAGVPVEPSDLEGHQAIAYGRRDEERNTRWVFIRAAQTETVEVPVRVMVRDGIGIVDAAIGGSGIARPFEFSVRQGLSQGVLQRVLPDWTSERQAVHAVLPPYGRAVPAKVRALLDHIEQVGAL